MADWNVALEQLLQSIGLTSNQLLALLFFIALVIVLYFGFKTKKN